jgi:hypothetical protein
MLATKTAGKFTHLLPRSQAWLEEVHVKLAKTIASGIDGGYFCNKNMGYGIHGKYGKYRHGNIHGKINTKHMEKKHPINSPLVNINGTHNMEWDDEFFQWEIKT